MNNNTLIWSGLSPIDFHQLDSRVFRVWNVRVRHCVMHFIGFPFGLLLFLLFNHLISNCLSVLVNQPCFWFHEVRATFSLVSWPSGIHVCGACQPALATLKPVLVEGLNHVPILARQAIDKLTATGTHTHSMWKIDTAHYHTWIDMFLVDTDWCWY